MRAPRRRLGSTYRVQVQLLSHGLQEVSGLVPYLAGLGIETLYLSPVTTARRGSPHGYDVVDATRVDGRLGGLSGLRKLLDVLDDSGMRLLLDIVPNHMAASSCNAWWIDVLRFGRQSARAKFFDIDWDAGDGRVLLPILGGPLDDVLERGEVHLSRESGEPEIVYFEQRLPVAEGTVPAEMCNSQARGSDEGGEGHGPMRRLLERQHYRLAYWRLSPKEVNYRRFFDIDDLVGLRVEDPSVYGATHRLVLELATDRRVAGLRVDHVDGLADPGGYLERLRADLDATSQKEPVPVVVVEKILQRKEALPPWPVEGTTGYEIADLAVALFVDAAGAEHLALTAPSGTGDFARLATSARRQVLRQLFPGAFEKLASRLGEALSKSGSAPCEPSAVHEALEELTVEMDVYRTYRARSSMSLPDKRILDSAAGRAAGSGRLGTGALRALALLLDAFESADAFTSEVISWQQLCGAVAAKGVEDTALYRFGGALCGADVGADPAAPCVAPAEFHRSMIARRRSWRGGLSATSTHDSKRSGDVRCRLAVLTEVAEELAGLFGLWHSWNEALVATTEGGPSPDLFEERYLYQTMIGAWPRSGMTSLQEGERQIFIGRLKEHLVKASREAKRRTSWLEPDRAHEEAVETFVERCLEARNSRFIGALERLSEQIGPAGATNALAMAVLRSTVPGVPDMYQGDELWALFLTDPDNRRPVDFAGRARILAGLREAAQREPATAARTALCSWKDGQVKLLVNHLCLKLRRDEPELFDRGGYIALEAAGPLRSHVVAYVRSYRSCWSLSVLPRLVYGAAGPGAFPLGRGVWAETSIAIPKGAPRLWTDVFTGRSFACPNASLAVGDLLDVLPVALLVPSVGAAGAAA